MVGEERDRPLPPRVAVRLLHVPTACRPTGRGATCRRVRGCSDAQVQPGALGLPVRGGEPGRQPAQAERGRVDRVGGHRVVPGADQQLRRRSATAVRLGASGGRRAPGSAATRPTRSRLGSTSFAGRRPASTLNPTAASATVVASTPCSTRPNQSSAPSWPGTTPGPGLSPTRPQQAAGMRIEPSPSLPCAIGTSPAATAAADPPDDPPGVRSTSHGLRVASPAVVGDRPQAQLRHPGHPDDDRPGAAQPADHLVVGLGDGRARRRRAVPGRQAGDRRCSP